ncbi:MAG: aminopeptidase [Gemmatimonadota bacterium]|nr:aminopeptidase [Gemmatimonadota bacterium]
MGILIAAAALFFGFGTAWLASHDVRYLTRAGLEEVAILQKARSLDDILADADTPPDTRAWIGLVKAARDFAASIGYEAGKTYTTYTDIGRDTLLLVVSASARECICPHIWKYPIVGRIPYKGFFDPAMAEREARQFRERGLDVYLRPASAFSTLGWFNDPLLSTAMVRDSVELAALVFHEIAHNTLYVKSATPFNESFAQMAGYRGAEAFFRSRGDTVLARRAADRWADEIVLAEYYSAFVERLEAFYATQPEPAALDSGRNAMAQWSREQLQGPYGARLKTYRVGTLAERPLNNAQLVGVRIYRTHLDWFEQWYHAQGADVTRAVAELRRLMEGAEGDEAFKRLAQATPVIVPKAPSPGR